MTFQKQNPAGFGSQPNITADILNGWNKNIARAVRTGRYTPANPITIDAFSSSNLGDVKLGAAATLERDPRGKWPLLLSVIDWDALVSLTHVFDTSSDLVMSDGTALTTPKDLILRTPTTGGTPQPRDGDIIRFSRPLEGAAIIRFFSGFVTSPQRVAIFPSAYTNQVASTPFYASFRFDSSAGDWEQWEMSGDVSI